MTAWSATDFKYDPSSPGLSVDWNNIPKIDFSQYGLSGSGSGGGDIAGKFIDFLGGDKGRQLLNGVTGLFAKQPNTEGYLGLAGLNQMYPSIAAAYNQRSQLNLTRAFTDEARYSGYKAADDFLRFYNPVNTQVAKMNIWTNHDLNRVARAQYFNGDPYDGFASNADRDSGQRPLTLSDNLKAPSSGLVTPFMNLLAPRLQA